jgi:hypothetical protein
MQLLESLTIGQTPSLFGSKAGKLFRVLKICGRASELKNDQQM